MDSITKGDLIDELKTFIDLEEYNIEKDIYDYDDNNYHDLYSSHSGSYDSSY